MGENVAADKPVGSPITIVKRMNIGEQKMEHRHPHKHGWPRQRGLFRSITSNLATSQIRF